MTRWLAIAVMLIPLAACAKTTTRADTPRRPSVSAEKWFVLFVRPDPMGGCTLEVEPSVDSGRGEVRVTHNWRVAWFVLNTCKAAMGQTPEIAFYYVDGGGTKDNETYRRNPVRWTTQSPDVLAGKVKGRDIRRKCEEDLNAPCGHYRYKVKVGDYVLDPDWEIIMF